MADVAVHIMTALRDVCSSKDLLATESSPCRVVVADEPILPVRRRKSRQQPAAVPRTEDCTVTVSEQATVDLSIIVMSEAVTSTTGSQVGDRRTRSDGDLQSLQHRTTSARDRNVTSSASALTSRHVTADSDDVTSRATVDRQAEWRVGSNTETTYSEPRGRTNISTEQRDVTSRQTTDDVVTRHRRSSSSSSSSTDNYESVDYSQSQQQQSRTKQQVCASLVVNYHRQSGRCITLHYIKKFE